MKIILAVFFACSFASLFAQTEPPPPPPVDSINIDGLVFTKVDVEATFTGGSQAWKRYLERNLNANVPVENDAPIGIYTVIAQFIVDKNGNISNIETLTDFGYGMEQEVIRILKKSPQWVPAMQNDRVVKAYRKQPITFVIEDGSIEIIMDNKYVLQAGEDKKIKINAEKIKTEDLEFSLTQGTINPDGNGGFVIRANNPGKAILSIYKKKKMLSSVYFIVKKKS